MEGYRYLCDMDVFFVTDALITTLSQRYNWNYEKYLIHATTGKAATSIERSKIQNYKYILGFFSIRLNPLPSNLLAISNKNGKIKA